MTMNPRKRLLLEELPKNNWKVKPSAIKAGYSPKYADKEGKKILKRALKAQAQEALEIATGNSASNPSPTSNDLKKELVALLGLTREDLFKRLKYIGFDQDKDLNSAIKILSVLGREVGFNLNPDEGPKTIVPILNIGVRELPPIAPPLEGNDPDSPTSNA